MSYSPSFLIQQKKDPFQNYQKVHEWLPSARPIFKSLLTRDLVRLDKVLTSEVLITKSCGKNRRVRKGTFLREYQLFKFGKDPDAFNVTLP